MKADQLTNPTAVFPNLVSVALTRLKQRLQQDYERTYPDLREIVHLVLDEEESKAWDLSPFPHLLLPDLVEAHIEKLNLRAPETKHEDVFAPPHFDEMPVYQSALALCG